MQSSEYQNMPCETRKLADLACSDPDGKCQTGAASGNFVSVPKSLQKGLEFAVTWSVEGVCRGRLP